MESTEAYDQARVGALIGGKYRLLRLLGAGGMGAVYEAENSWTGRRVAVKVLRPQHARRKEASRRFMREARAAARIAHTNVVDILDMGEDPSDGALFIVQELLVGEDLRRRLGIVGRLRPREALEVLVPIMGALVAVHRRGIVHRDIKPENIFLARGPHGEVVPKLIDFGISKVMDAAGEVRSRTRTGMALGTPDYMSPEQARGDASLDARTDVWSLGAVLYEMLSGRCPFEAPNYNLLVVKIITESPPDLRDVAPGVPEELATLVHRALEPDRERRFPSVGAFLEALLESPAYQGLARPGSALEAARKDAEGARARAITLDEDDLIPVEEHARRRDVLELVPDDDEDPRDEARRDSEEAALARQSEPPSIVVPTDPARGRGLSTDEIALVLPRTQIPWVLPLAGALAVLAVVGGSILLHPTAPVARPTASLPSVLATAGSALPVAMPTPAPIAPAPLVVPARATSREVAPAPSLPAPRVVSPTPRRSRAARPSGARRATVDPLRPVRSYPGD